MSNQRSQSAIREVRDQLSLDYSDGKYLNVVSANLGIDRPIFGFTDDTWRAVVKAIALQFKQVNIKFHDVLSVLFGPQETVAAALSVAAEVGDTIVTLVSTDGMPQIGFIVLDESMADEETLEYCYIDRVTNEVFLAEGTTVANAHAAFVDGPVSAMVLGVDPSATKSFVVLHSSEVFPDPATTAYPINLYREELYPTPELVSEAASFANGILTFTGVAGVTPASRAEVTLSRSRLSTDYSPASFLLSLDDSSDFSDEGYALIGADAGPYAAVSGTATTVTSGVGSFRPSFHVGHQVIFSGNVTTALKGASIDVTGNTATTLTFSGALPGTPVAGDTFTIRVPIVTVSGSTTTAVAAASTFTEHAHVGSRVLFEGNTTAALAGRVVTIKSNTTDTLTFLETLSSAPAAGDRFYILPVVKYGRNDKEDNVLILKAVIADITVLNNAPIEQLKGTTVSMAPAQVKGTSWDVIQPFPRQLEIYLPSGLDDVSDLKSASYLHTEYIDPTPATTNTVGITAGDTEVTVDDLTSFPEVGVLTVGSDTVAYGIFNLVDTVVDSVSTTTVIEVAVGSLVASAWVGEQLLVNGEYREVTANTTDDFTVSPALSAAPKVGDVVLVRTVRIPETSEFLASHAISTAVTLYQPRYGSDDLLVGNLWTLADTFPGPYVYEIGEDSPAGTLLQTTLTENLPGPTRVSVDQEVSKTALEVEDATLYPLTGFPYNVRIGRKTGNNELVTVNEIILKQRIQGITVASAVSVGDTEIELSSLSAFGADASDLLNINGYRVRIGAGTGNDEILLVLGTDTGPDRILVQAATNVHAVSETVELLSDVLSVNSLNDFHNGIIDLGDRFTLVSLGGTALSVVQQTKTDEGLASAELAEFNIEEFDLASISGLATTGGKVLLGFGGPFNVDLPIVSHTVNDLTFSDSSAFPSVYPYKVIVGPNTALEERVLITGNTGTVLTVGGGVVTLKNTHPAGTSVTYEQGAPEDVDYAAISGTTLSFSTPIVVKSSHQLTETAIPSLVESDPSTAGTDFPLRIPPSLQFRIEFLFDLIRAAGVTVSIINKR